MAYRHEQNGSRTMETPVFGNATSNLVQARRYFRLALTALERAHHGVHREGDGTSAIQRAADATQGIIEEIDSEIFANSDG